MYPSEDDINVWIEDIHKKLRDCQRFLDEKRQAYELFDRYSSVSEDPYSLRARTMDSRGDSTIVQWLNRCKRGIPESAEQVHCVDELAIRWREVNNFWTDLWEAVQRAKVRAKMAEHEYYASADSVKQDSKYTIMSSGVSAQPSLNSQSGSASGSIGSGSGSGSTTVSLVTEPSSSHSMNLSEAFDDKNIRDEEGDVAKMFMISGSEPQSIPANSAKQF